RLRYRRRHGRGPAPAVPEPSAAGGADRGAARLGRRLRRPTADAGRPAIRRAVASGGLRRRSARAGGDLLALLGLLAGQGQRRPVALVPELVAVGVGVARPGGGSGLRQHQFAALVGQGDGAGAVVEAGGQVLFAALPAAFHDAFVGHAGAGGVHPGGRRGIGRGTGGRRRLRRGSGITLAPGQDKCQQRRKRVRGAGHAERSWPLCRPSAISSTSLEQNAGRSSGVRLVTRPWSTTTSRSTQRAPAFCRSRWMLGTEVSSRSPTTPASASTQGPWQIAPTGLPASKNERVKRIACSSARSASGLNSPPGITRAS